MTVNVYVLVLAVTGAVGVMNCATALLIGWLTDRAAQRAASVLARARLDAAALLAQQQRGR